MARGKSLALERAKPRKRRRAVVKPLAPGRFKVQLTAGQSLYDKLRQAQDLMRHELPSGDLEVICERALDLLLAKLLRRKLAATDRPRSSATRRKGREEQAERVGNAEQPDAADADGPSPQAAAAPSRSTPRSRHIPAAVKRTVAERDGMRCTFVDARGRRCAETGGLEFHHIEGFARGGESTVDNVSLRCRAHNRYDAEQHYGAATIERRIQQQRERRTRPPMASRRL